MIQITKYAVPKKNNGTSSNNSGFANVTNNNTTVINGGDILVDSELSTTSTNAVQNAVITNAINQTISALTNTDGTISISKDGRTVTIGSNTWKLDDNDNLSYSGNIFSSGATFENLTVTKAAHFFQLIIDEIKSTKGQILITAANAKLDLVEESQNSFKCYWKNTDGDKTIYNQFAVDDQVICQTFNLDDTSGTNQTNKFYWSKVISVGTETKEGETYNYIVLSTTDKDANSNAIPAVGDEIALLGNRTNTDRQAAIIISAYNNQFLDPTIKAPSIVQYSGINDYNLNTHRLNVISNGFNSFKGNFTTTAGEDIANNSRKNFPIIKPFYDSSMNTIVTNYLSDPIRYNGGDDIYSTPTYVEKGTYNFRIFSTVSNASSLLSWFALCSYGTKYPSDISHYETVDLPLSNGGTIRAKNSTTLYEYKCTVTIPTSGYYAINFWYDSEYIYIPNDEDTFEISNSKIEQTNTRITTTVNNINGQISTINQTAENIEAKVDNVSVKIDSGQITLNGNTKVQGDLTISDSTNGFTLTNDDNYNTIIKPQSIGEYEDYKSGKSSNSYYANGTNNVLTVENSKSNQSKPTNTEYFEVRYTCDNINKYNLVSGQTLHLTSYQDFQFIPNRFTAYNGYPYKYYFFNGQYTPSTTDFDSKIFLNGHYAQGLIEQDVVLMSAHIYSISTRFSIINSTNTEVGYTVVNGLNPTLNYTFTATTADEYTIKAAVTVRFNTMQNGDVKNNTRRRMDYVFRDYVMSQFTFTIESTLNTNEIENKIGYDGISLSLGNNNIVYIGKDSAHIKYGNYDLMVDSDGIKKYVGLTASTYQNEGDATDTALSKYISEYAPINGCAVRELLQQGTYYLQPRDEVIIYKATDGGGDATFYLGNPTLSKNIGRKVYMKVYSNKHYIIVYGRSTTYYDIIQSAGRNPSQKYEVNDRGVMFVSDGSKWLSYVSY